MSLEGVEAAAGTGGGGRASSRSTVFSPHAVEERGVGRFAGGNGYLSLRRFSENLLHPVPLPASCDFVWFSSLIHPRLGLSTSSLSWSSRSILRLSPSLLLPTRPTNLSSFPSTSLDGLQPTLPSTLRPRLLHPSLRHPSPSQQSLPLTTALFRINSRFLSVQPLQGLPLRSSSRS